MISPHHSHPTNVVSLSDSNASGQIMTFFKHKKLDMWILRIGPRRLTEVFGGAYSEAYLLRRPEKGAEKCAENP